MEYGKFLDIKDVCKHLNVSERTIRKEINMFPDKFPFVTSIGQKLIVHESIYKRWTKLGSGLFKTRISDN
tara:strand:+ start:415 stop:624 length:210 start_codon:yes stop_codon:yes gene_type:complete